MAAAGRADVDDSAALLRAHDEDLRTGAELAGADRRERLGPLWLGWFADRGFVTYRDLDGMGGHELDALIAAAVQRFASDPSVESFEWKTRGHDQPADLDLHLAAAGLAVQDVETVMIGDAAALATGAQPPPGVLVRRAGDGGDLAADVAAVGRLHRQVFGPGSPDLDDQLLRRLSSGEGTDELWLAEQADKTVLCAGRLTRVPGTRFAGLFGGATAAQARHRGIYRALTAARARAALAMGAALVYAECTPFSRPILARSGLVPVTTTTPWLWRRRP